MNGSMARVLKTSKPTILRGTVWIADRGRLQAAPIKWSRDLERTLCSGETWDTWIRDVCRRRNTDHSANGPCMTLTLFLDGFGSKDALFPSVERMSRSASRAEARSQAYCVLAIDGFADIHLGSAISCYLSPGPCIVIEQGRSRTTSPTGPWNSSGNTTSQGEPNRNARSPRRRSPITSTGSLTTRSIVRSTPSTSSGSSPEFRFTPTFWKWSDWGEELMNSILATNRPVGQAQTDRCPRRRGSKIGCCPRSLLKADKEGGRILIDGETTLRDPAEAWDYRLGNRTALEWVLDQSRKETRRIRRFARSSTPTVSPTTKKRSSTCSRGSRA